MAGALRLVATGLALAAACEPAADDGRFAEAPALLRQLDELRFGASPAEVAAWAGAHGLGSICRDAVRANWHDEVGIRYGVCEAEVSLSAQRVGLEFVFLMRQNRDGERATLVEVRITPAEVALMDSDGWRGDDVVRSAARLAWGAPTTEQDGRTAWRRRDRVATVERDRWRLEPPLVLTAADRRRR